MKLWKARLPAGYGEQTYASPYAIVRYPHQKRIRMGVESTIEADPLSVLDYGAGDGKVLIEALQDGLPDHVQLVAFEPVEQARQKFLEAIAAAGFVDRIDLAPELAHLEAGSFDYILCLGVLEHMTVRERNAFYDICAKTLTANGSVLIDVPVEVGPTLLVKAVARRLLKGRDKEWRISELTLATLGWPVFDPGRFDPRDSRTWIHHHKGFDYRLLKREIETRFRIESQANTPIGWLPAPLGNQEVFLTLKHK